MLQPEILICELLPVDRFASHPVAEREVAPLRHELGDHPVELGALEMERLAGGAHALLSGAEGAEVFRSLRRRRVKVHDNTTAVFAHADVHVDFRVNATA